MENPPNSPQRPSHASLLEKIDLIRRCQTEDENRFHEWIEEIRDLAEGRGDASVHEQFYPGYTDKDFQILLNELEREGLAG